MTGDQLRQQRMRLELTQGELAAILGSEQEHISRWETGVHRVPKLIARIMKDKFLFGRLKRNPP